MKAKKVVTDFRETGECGIDVAQAAKGWNERCSISQWHDEYTLVQKLRRNTRESYSLKVRISGQQARELIAAAELVNVKSPVFRNASSWVKEEQIAL